MNYKVEFDVCTYTDDDIDAFSTITENIGEAKNKNLKGIGIISRGYVHNNDKTERIINAYFDLPNKINGLEILKGLEMSLTSLKRADVDVSSPVLSRPDFTMISYYPQGFVYCTPSKEDIVFTLKTAVNSINIDGVGQLSFDGDEYIYEDIVSFCKRNNKFIEFSNDKIKNNQISRENAKTVANLCKKYFVPIIVTSGARISYDVGNFSSVFEILNEVNFPQELILNETQEKFMAFVNKY